MVSLRCKMLVSDEIKKLGVSSASVELGVVEFQEDLSEKQLEKFRENLKKAGLELLNDEKKILVENIKKVIIEMIDNHDEILTVNDSDFISKKLKYDYANLSNAFTEVTGITIQQYIIMQKIEKVKELLLYDDLTLTEIAYQLQYSSVAHLSNQFKRVTGLTATYFKEMKLK